MIAVLPTVLTVLALVGAACAVVLIVRKQAILPLTKQSWTLVAALAVLELGLIVQAVIGLIQLAGTDREIDRLSFVGYLVGPAVIVPAALAWGAVERTRWSAGVPTLACLSVPVMIVRLGQIWAGHA